jgi:transitional endoplasmic reticulum ATPase
MTPAAIEKIVDTAALEVFREATQSGRQLELTTENLLAAIERYGGEDRPTVEHWTWDSLILPARSRPKLQQLQARDRGSRSARRFGVEPATGLLLAGPPGNRARRRSARCSPPRRARRSIPISGADVMSKWVGESEQNIRQLFERAAGEPPLDRLHRRDRRDRRQAAGVARSARQPRQPAAAEIDGVSGQRGVFVVGATEPARPARPGAAPRRALSRTIVLGLPDEAGPPRDAAAAHRADADGRGRPAGARRADGRLLAGRSQVAGAGGRAGGYDAHRRNASGPASVTQEDFDAALDRLRPAPRAR